jgi:DNA end-binding protein Ku
MGNVALPKFVAPQLATLVDQRLKPEQGHAIEIQEFVDLEQVDPVYFDRPYYVSPDKGGAKGYRLLVEAIEQSGKVGIARFVMRQRQHLAVLRVREHALVLETMHYHDEVGDVAELDVPGRTSVNERERELAVQIIESMATTFEPERYTDEYREQLEELIRQRAEGAEETVLAQPPPEPGGKVIDLMEALKKSLARRNEEAAGAGADTGARRKSPGKRAGKTPAKARTGRTRAARTTARSARSARNSKTSKTSGSLTARTKTSGTRSRSNTSRTRPKKRA